MPLVLRFCANCGRNRNIFSFGVRNGSFRTGTLRTHCKECEAKDRSDRKTKADPSRPIRKVIVTDVKSCSKCKEIKDLTCFNANTKGPGGYTSRCKACIAIGADTPEARKARAERTAKTYYNNHELAKEKARNYYKQNSKELGDTYIKKALHQSGFSNEIPSAIVNTYRLIIKIKRKLNESHQ
jgi:hypothetical protein